MRKPRDFDAEMKALSDKAALLKERKLRQLGELVVATGADGLPVEQLAGALLSAIDSADAATKEVWRKRGAGFFQRTGSRNAAGARRNAGGATTGGDSASPPRSEAGA